MAENILVRVEDEINTRASRPSILRPLDCDLLKQNITEFLSSVDEILSSGVALRSRFEVAEVTVKAEITASGKVALLGNGVEASGSAALEFTFRPRSAQSG